MANVPAILVVEDDPSVQATLCATLTLMGFKPFHADTIERALMILGAERVDAVSLDVRLPDPKGLQRSGLTLLAFMRATPEYAHIPVLVFTGVHLSPEEQSLVERHRAGVFYKPQPYSELAEWLMRMLSEGPRRQEPRPA